MAPIESLKKHVKEDDKLAIPKHSKLDVLNIQTSDGGIIWIELLVSILINESRLIPNITVAISKVVLL